MIEEQRLNLSPLVSRNEYEQQIRRNKYIGGKIKKEQTECVAWECKAQKIKAFNLMMTVRFVWKHPNRRTDIDNVESGQKFVWDGLVLGGIIRNDTWKHRPTTTVHEHTVDKRNPGVEVIMSGVIHED